ncbi:diaminopimelate epimerase [Sphingomonas morindae]|uniref:Diaminopimelate epimerase n=1 Tax=Sphingomonas morindae TaxID=1541170 RepID=A0ABY4X8B4_9SPHN|nr:diaminopimelate epimerase [Sphingomonas morindae]USI73080.1 diaminopimelate epimerase [Sphingomonas morindae]
MRRFHKMHGLGNDFVVLDARAQPLAMTAERARLLADRHRGIGCDQLILLEPVEGATARMRIFNPDGGEVEACGNATRCVATLLGDGATIETRGGRLEARLTGDGATISMGAPRFDWDAIPLAYPLDTAALPVAWEGLAPVRPPMAVNMGNPHIVFFVPDCDAVDLGAVGPAIETDPLFPARINVNIATITARDAIRLRVWERGAGATLACGTGACATAVAAIRAGLCDPVLSVTLPGGTLRLAWHAGGPVQMTGPARYVFGGEIDLEALAP